MAGSVKANPGLYFGAYPAADWPLVIAAWTAADLLRLAPSTPTVDVTLHHNGALSATVRGATVPAAPRPVADIIRSGMWYTELSRTTTIHATTPHATPGPAWTDLTVTVHSDLDADLFGLPAGTWWHNGVQRFAGLLTNPRHRPPDGRHVDVWDEATGERAELPLATAATS
ncbi:hypothetical protein [Dactylosporangium matsuzakiense]|uniref:hypothetical protein n=1 Tax=Dactylosporangium matsuzakiense TaxID=53360 RepID=UPI0021C32F43|nr:hypothetical protein [Dactylosporangium matsuzakiense]UWZ41650.1 hypothetical protein Dmats_28865 [Dactylosporangium matsuzakiense]